MKKARLLLAAALAAGALAVVPDVVPTAAAPVDPACSLCAGGELQPTRGTGAPVRIFSTISRLNDVVKPGAKAMATGAGATFDLDLLGVPTPLPRPWLPDTVDATTDVLAVAVSITVYNPTQRGNLTAFATGAARPLASNVNFAARQTVSNLAIVRPNAAGRLSINLVSAAAGTAHVAIDVVGWFSTSTYGKDSGGVPDPGFGEHGSRLVGLTPPRRLVDTRNGSSADTPVRAGAPRTVKIAGGVVLGTTSLRPVPAGSVAAVLNITAVAPTATTSLSVTPQRGALPPTVNLSARAGEVRGAMVITPLGPDGTVTIYNRTGAANVTVDVLGYFRVVGAETTETRAGRVVPLNVPFRAFDTRAAAFGKVPLGPGQAEDWSFAAFSTSVNIGGQTLGPQTALLGNLTNASLTRQLSTVPVSSYLTVYPTPASTATKPPLVANLNSAEGAVVGNMALVTYGGSQTVRVYNVKGYAHYVLDVYAVVLGN